MPKLSGRPNWPFDDLVNRKRLTIGAVDGVAGFRRLVADSPSGGREFSDSIDGKIGQARKHRTQIVANW